LMRKLNRDGKSVPLIVIENVVGLLTSHRGNDFIELIRAVVREDYRVGALIMNAVHFVPQSRARLFIIAVKKTIEMPKRLTMVMPDGLWHTKSLIQSYQSLPDILRKAWIWWNLTAPKENIYLIQDIIENPPHNVKWHSDAETKHLLSMMSENNLKKVRIMQKTNKTAIGAVYKRTRRDENGNTAVRAEVRFDGVSGCLRTPAGGSSRQTILFVDKNKIRSRLLSSRETARLMGVHDDYILPDNYNDCYHLMGDGLVVPAVSWLEKNLLRPLVKARVRARGAA